MLKDVYIFVKIRDKEVLMFIKDLNRSGLVPYLIHSQHYM